MQQTTELRAALCRRIDALLGRQEKLHTAIAGLTLIRRVRPTAPSCITYEPSLALIAQGRKEVILGDQTLIYDQSRYLLTSVDLPILSRIRAASAAKPFIALALRLDIPTVREILSRSQFPVSHSPPLRPAMATAETTPEILDACYRLVGLLSQPREIPVLADLFQREIIYRVLQGPAGARLRAIATLDDPCHRMARVIHWIRTHYAEPLRVQDLAGLAGMGVSTFHHHFRGLTAMSPLQFQKQFRLQIARALLLTHQMDAASAAFAVGYESASQFSREYRRFFGQSPIRDVRSLRAAAANATVLLPEPGD
ncbi:MAG: AraC family transcriptional regulator N-terminal domain-containing protein [Acidobacteriota bacterium]